jgi:2-dehydropantoate 2-reductase
LLARPAALARAVAAAREALEVGRERRVAVDPAEAAALIEGVCRRTAANRSSMLQDLEAGRRTEVDQLNGAVVGLAAWDEDDEHPAPVNAALLREIKQREKALTHA